MSDAMQIAHQRRKDYRDSIAQKEAEIAELHELIADLDSFIEFGDSLMGKQTQKPAEPAKPSITAAPKPQIQAPTPLDEDDDDDWGDDAPPSSIETRSVPSASG